MNRTQSYVGPRGWAVLTLAGGAALASPFLRPAQIDVSKFERGSATARLSAWSPTHAEPTGSGASSSALPGRIVSGTLPTTVSKLEEWTTPDTPVLPAWVPPRSPLDDLISRTKSPVAQAEPLPNLATADLQPLRAWRGGRLLRQEVPQRADLENEPSLARSPLRDSPWNMADAAKSAPHGAQISTDEQRFAGRWPDSHTDPKWPDQTLAQTPQELARLESSAARVGERDRRLVPAEHDMRIVDEGMQRTVSAALPPPLANPPRPVVIGATLSRSPTAALRPKPPIDAPSSQGNQPNGTQLNGSPGAASKVVDEKRFVLQPGLRQAP